MLTPADEAYHINKHDFHSAVRLRRRDLGEALRRIGEGAAMIRTKGEAGTGNIVEAVRHLRAVTDGIRKLTILPDEELMAEAKNLRRALRAGARGARARAAAGACTSAPAAWRRRPTRR